MKKFILLLSMLLALSVSSVGYAAEDNASPENNVITLEQAKALAYENSRSLKKYEISKDKAKYQKQQTEYEYNTILDRYNSIGKSLESDEGDSESIWDQLESQYEKVEASSGSIDDAENNYNDSVKEEKNYRTQLVYIIEELYTTILNQEESLLALNKEYEIKQYLLNIERQKLALGSSNLLTANELAVEVNSVNKSIIEQTNQIKTKKGQLNDMMGRGYDDELELVPVEVSTTVEIPEYNQLLSSATYAYNLLSQLKRDINDLEDDLDDEDDYYQSLILRQEIKEKELQLEDEKKNLNDTINNLIADVKSKQEDYQISLTNYQNAQRSYDWDKKRFELGQISKLALMESEQNYLNLKNKKVSAGNALFLAQRTLQLAEEGILT
ncbi:TolC family protein [Desulforamulus ruminis]|uniref:Outer membrane protein-like protein n=1 Tax=Desulforamulus ruminis (strain ATCC 23193 / DSM 2154 / NCIMB 8452 / DL) TaxID=696281 RepID=F6DKF7_DESRL|nr:TolC family protein [Desulforamulus ruminis]AEG59217.1 outer membrane protein-like protein [Desulforamulus ruminis DSM 2154]